jgi:transposase
MNEAAIPLPDDLAVCHGMIRELAASLRAAQRQVEQLGHRLDLLLRRLYGPRSERDDPDQLLLSFDPAEDRWTPSASAAESTPEPAPPSRARPLKGHGRRALPADLPRERRVYEVPPEQRACPGCGRERTPIGEETSEQLDYRPVSLFVVEHVRVKVACRHCQEHVAVASKPPQRSRKGCRGRGCSRRSSRASSPITCPYIGKRASLPATGSNCRASPCAAGWPSRPGCWGRSGRR